MCYCGDRTVSKRGLYKRRLGKVKAIDSRSNYSMEGKRSAKRIISRVEKRRANGVLFRLLQETSV